MGEVKIKCPACRGSGRVRSEQSKAQSEGANMHSCGPYCSTCSQAEDAGRALYWGAPHHVDCEKCKGAKYLVAQKYEGS